MSIIPDPRRHSVVTTAPCEELAGLDLDRLRSYRRELEAEEDRAAYWQRLVRVHIDLIEAESSVGAPLTMEQLVRVLGDTGSGRSRSALVRATAAEPLPGLPNLSEIWDIRFHPHEPAEAGLQRLRTAERQLTAYVLALHERIDGATRELILRYRADPLAALSVIPKE